MRRTDPWDSGDAYEPYVGRWSRLVAARFLDWAEVPRSGWVLDVGCGTGALAQAALAHGSAQVVGIDPSPAYAAFASSRIGGTSRVRFVVGDAMHLPVRSGSFDAVVAGLVLNFVPNAAVAAREMTRTARPPGVVAAYVWDYAGRMELMRYFWDAAVDLDVARAGLLDEGVRFPLCHPDRLAQLFRDADLAAVEVTAIDIPTLFQDFDDYWRPFLGGQGPAPSYAVSLDERQRTRLRDRIRAKLPVNADGTISLIARAWAVRGYKA